MDKNENTKLMKKNNSLLKKIIEPDNVMSFSIKFPYKVSEFTQDVVAFGNFDSYILKNLELTTSQSWLNVSAAIGNNLFYAGQIIPGFFDGYSYTQTFPVQNKVPSGTTPLNLNQLNYYNYTVWPSNTRTFQPGSVDSTGNLVPDPSGYTWTSYPYPVGVYSNINVTPITSTYKFKISIFDVTIPGGAVFNVASSETVYSNATRTLSLNLPAYAGPGAITYQSFVINVQRVDGLQITPSELLPNICNFVSDAPLDYSALSILKTLPTGSSPDITFQYSYTFDYNLSLLIWNTNGDFFNEIAVPANTNPGTNITFTVPNIAGKQFNVGVETISNRPLNPGDFTNLAYIFNTLAVGNTITPIITIPDGFYTGILNNSTTNPVSFGWKFIWDKIVSTSGLNMTYELLPNNFIKYTNNTVNSITISWDNGSTDTSAGRILGFYNQDSFTMLGNQSTTSTDPIDLDSNGRFNKISIQFPQLASVGYAAESNNIISLQKGSYFGQALTTANPSYQKLIPTSNISSVTFFIVDGQSYPLNLLDSAQFSCQIEVRNFAD
jgi:hypothetical protein